jgi:hypothetical protein
MKTQLSLDDLPFTSPRLRGEVGPQGRVRGDLSELYLSNLPLTPTLSPQAGRGSAPLSGPLP